MGRCRAVCCNCLALGERWKKKKMANKRNPEGLGKRGKKKAFPLKRRSFKTSKTVASANHQTTQKRKSARPEDHEKVERMKDKKHKPSGTTENTKKSALTFPINAPPSQQLQFFLDRFQSSLGVTLSSLELEGITDSSVLELPHSPEKDVSNISEHLKASFGVSWEETLCEAKLIEGKIQPGNPAVIVICSSALRSLEMLRGLKSLTRECCAVKLFSKHIKVDDQVSLLKNRVDIASGTPSRIKKLIDMDALGLSQLSVVVLDTHLDAKGYSLLTLPQVSLEFWELYKMHLHERLRSGSLRLCFY